jgi:uncharacterized membrane protein
MIRLTPTQELEYGGLAILAGAVAAMIVIWIAAWIAEIYQKEKP